MDDLFEEGLTVTVQYMLLVLVISGRARMLLRGSVAPARCTESGRSSLDRGSPVPSGPARLAVGDPSMGLSYVKATSTNTSATASDSPVDGMSLGQSLDTGHHEKRAV